VTIELKDQSVLEEKGIYVMYFELALATSAAGGVNTRFPVSRAH